ncbi:MAG: DUF4157 domain-containing protein [Flammeovirgaceae bacterium]|nr:DUF4157 domain-containing protein [Flammeovirgaceae bacterium]
MKVMEAMSEGPRAQKTAQLQALMPDNSPLQKAADEEEVQMKAAPVQKKENNTGLPDNLKSGVESLSGISMNDVKVHPNSDQPAQLQAHAFAQGTDIHVAPGQEKHLAHESWHVVQQKQGRVKPTTQMKGQIPVNDDMGLEHEADVMGAKALSLGNSDQEATQLKKLNVNSSAIHQFADAQFVTEEERDETHAEAAKAAEIERSKKANEENPKDAEAMDVEDVEETPEGAQWATEEDYRRVGSESPKDVEKEETAEAAAKNRERIRIKEKLEKKKDAQFYYHELSRKNATIRTGITHTVQKGQKNIAKSNLSSKKVIADSNAIRAYNNETSQKDPDERESIAKAFFSSSFYSKLDFTKVPVIDIEQKKSIINAQESRKTEGKNKVDMALLNAYNAKSTKIEDNKDSSTNELGELYTYAKLRTFDVDKRTERESQKESDLKEQGRVVGPWTTEGFTNAAKEGTSSFFVSLFSAGARKKESGISDTGVRGGFNVADDLTKKAADDSGGGWFPKSLGLFERFEKISDGFNKEKAKADQSMSKAAYYMILSSGLGALKKVLNIGSGILSAIGNWLTLASAIPGAAVFTTPALLVINGLKKIFSVVDAVLTGSIVLFDSIAQLRNDNPLLNVALSNKTKDSALSAGAKATSMGVAEASTKINIGDTKATTKNSKGNLLSGDKDLLGNDVTEKIDQSAKDKYVEAGLKAATTTGTNFAAKTTADLLSANDKSDPMAHEKVDADSNDITWEKGEQKIARGALDELEKEGEKSEKDVNQGSTEIIGKVSEGPSGDIATDKDLTPEDKENASKGEDDYKKTTEKTKEVAKGVEELITNKPKK